MRASVIVAALMALLVAGVVKLADGRSIDLVICYHCFQMEIFDESGDYTYVGVGTASEPLLSEQLKTGGVEYVDRLGQFLRSQADNS